MSRIDTKLSRLLIQRGAVDDRTIEKAFDLTSAHGGTLDTVLLELNALPESDLRRALADAWETEPITALDLRAPEKQAVAKLTRAMAVQLMLCPTRLDGNRLHVMSRSPRDDDLLREIGALLALEIVPHVVPEVRLWEALNVAYGVTVPERYVFIRNQLSEPLSSPGTKSPAPSTPVSDAFSSMQAIVESSVDRATFAENVVTAARHVLPFAAMIGVRNDVGYGWSRSGTYEGPQFDSTPFHIGGDTVLADVTLTHAPFIGRPAITEGNLAFFGWVGRRRPRTGLLIPITIRQRTVAVLYADGGIRQRDIESLTPLLSLQMTMTKVLSEIVLAHGDALSYVPAPPILDDALGFEDSPTKVEAPAFDERAFSDDEATAPAIAEESETDEASVEQTDSVISAVETPRALPMANDESSERETLGDPVVVTTFRSGKLPLDVDEFAERSIEEEARDFDRSATPIESRRGRHIAAADRTAEASSRVVSEDEIESFVDNRPKGGPLPAPSDGEISSFVDEKMSLPQATPHEGSDAKPSTAYLIDEGETVVEEDVSLDGHVLRELHAPRAREGASAPPLTTSLHQLQTPVAVRSPSGVFAWNDALQRTVERGHQGGSTNADDEPLLDSHDGWDDVEFNDATPIAPPLVVDDRPSEPSLPRTPAPPDDDDDEQDQVSSETLPAGTSNDDDARQKRISDDATRLSLEQLTALARDLDAPPEDETAARATELLFYGGERADEALAQAFPGRMRVDPFSDDAGVETAADLSGLVAFLARIGPRGLKVANQHLESRFPTHRFAAVFLNWLASDDTAIDALQARLHDPEPKIRALASAALAEFIGHPKFERVLKQLRARLQSQSVTARVRAVQLVGNFRDVSSIPSLIRLLQDQGEDVAPSARAALRITTLQDFGPRSKPWLRWWELAQNRSRVEWMIDALHSRDRELRFIAAAELARLAGDAFGYDPDATRRVRDDAAKHFQTWWELERAAMTSKTRGPRKSESAAS